MSDEKGLLAAIWEHPHDDTPRLVYADWLQENGQPERAEFIRVQCELFRLDEDDPRRGELEKRAAKLARSHREQWIVGLPKLLTRARFVRGFVYPRMRGLRANQFLALKPADLAPAPLWSFRIEAGTKVWPAVADSPSLRRIEHLDLGNNLLDESSAVRILSSTHLLNVSNLGLGLSHFTPAAMTALARNDTLAHLKELTLSGNDMTDDTFSPLASSSRLAAVETLILTQNDLTAVSMRAIAESPHTTRLRSVDLFGTEIGDEGVRALCRSALRLRVLNLLAVGMTDASATAIAKWPGLQSLRFLTLGAAALTAKTAKAFVASRYFRDDVMIDFWTAHLNQDKAAVKLLKERFGENVTFWY